MVVELYFQSKKIVFYKGTTKDIITNKFTV